MGPARVFIIVLSVVLLVVCSPVSGPDQGCSFRLPPLEASVRITTRWKTVQRGDTASALLGKYLSAKEIYRLEKEARDIFPLARIRQGRPYGISLKQGTFFSFEYEINSRDRLVIRKEDGGVSVEKSPIPYDLRLETVTVDIQTSLAEGVKRAGEKHTLAWKLADIFAWDIDFIRDIRPGDRFSALVEKRYKRDRFCGYGQIRAAFFTNGGKTHKAFLHRDDQGRTGYFNEKGLSLEKAFLKAPLNYSRISSAFSLRRFHPILKRYRAHPGVDYAAPRNTPIKAVADGEIASIYYSKTTGRQITLRHAGGYETSYFHMNKYGLGMKKNKKVSQGDIIGYVGKTGLATGYHLCFRMRKNGRPVNPLDHSPSDADPVRPEEMGRFAALAGKYTQQLMPHQKLARITTPDPG